MLQKLKAMLEASHSSARLSELKPEPSVAVCAVLLEVASADNDFAVEERHAIAELIGAHFDLNSDEAEALMDQAQKERTVSPDLWPFTHTISQHFLPEEKAQVMEMVWRVVFADGRLDAHEEMLVRKLQSMLGVNHSLVMDAKQRAREFAATIDLS